MSAGDKNVKKKSCINAKTLNISWREDILESLGCKKREGKKTQKPRPRCREEAGAIFGEKPLGLGHRASRFPPRHIATEGEEALE